MSGSQQQHFAVAVAAAIALHFREVETAGRNNSRLRRGGDRDTVRGIFPLDRRSKLTSVYDTLEQLALALWIS